MEKLEESVEEAKKPRSWLGMTGLAAGAAGLTLLGSVYFGANAYNYGVKAEAKIKDSAIYSEHRDLEYAVSSFRRKGEDCFGSVMVGYERYDCSGLSEEINKRKERMEEIENNAEFYRVQFEAEKLENSCLMEKVGASLFGVFSFAFFMLGLADLVEKQREYDEYLKRGDR